MRDRIIEKRIIEFPKQQTDHKFLLETLQRKFSPAFIEFNSFLGGNKEYLTYLMSFLDRYNIAMTWRVTNPIKTQYHGTYSYKVRIDQRTATNLGRRSRTFTYYGLKSSHSAIEKGIEKSFHVINCLITEQSMPDETKTR